VTLSPEPPGIFRLGLAPAGAGALGPMGGTQATTPAVWRGRGASLWRLESNMESIKTTPEDQRIPRSLERPFLAALGRVQN